MPIRAKFGHFGAKNPKFYWRNQKFCYPLNGKPIWAPSSHCFLVRHGTKWAKKCQYLANNVQCPMLGPKILIFMRVSKSFGTQIMEKPPRQLVPIVFWLAWEQMGQKCRYLAKNARFGPNLAVFWTKIQFFVGRE